MELARQTALRVSDLLSLNERENMREEGIYIETGKTGKWLLFQWTPELLAIVDRARKLRGKVRSTHILSTQEGQRYTLSGFETLWQRLIKKAVKDEKIKVRFRFNDLRAMAADLSANATELLGHDDPRTTNRVYRRAPRKVTPNR
jgi:integrase